MVLARSPAAAARTRPVRARYAARRGGGGGRSTVSIKTGTGGTGGTGFEILLASFYLANMTEVIEATTGAAKLFLEFRGVSIDNASFKLFYRATTMILVISSVLASAKQVFGDPISCGVVSICFSYAA